MLDGTVRIELVDRGGSPAVSEAATIHVILDAGEDKPFMTALEMARKTLETMKRYGNG